MLIYKQILGNYLLALSYKHGTKKKKMVFVWIQTKKIIKIWFYERYRQSFREKSPNRTKWNGITD